MNENKSTVVKLSSKAENILSRINSETKMGDLRKIAKEIKKDHELAMELWSTGEYLPRLLSILIMNRKFLTEDVIDKLSQKMQTHSLDHLLIGESVRRGESSGRQRVGY